MVPTSLLAGLILVLADQQIRAILRTIPVSEISRHSMDLLAVNAIRFASFFLSWLLGAFALAAIAMVIHHSEEGEAPVNWKHDSYERAREHGGALLVIATVTLIALLLGMGGISFVELAGFRVFGRSGFLPYNYAVSVAGYVIVASVVSWLGAAIPLVIKGDISVWRALQKSVELSSGYEGALFLLVIESVVGSVIVWNLVVRGLPLLLPPDLILSSWYGWLRNLAGLLASAAVEPPLFIGFSLLADSGQFETMDLV